MNTHMHKYTEGSFLAYAAAAPERAFPAYATIPDWCAISGMGRSKTYEALGRGDLRAIKIGNRTLIDVAPGLQWMDSLPQANIRPHGAKRTKQLP